MCETPWCLSGVSNSNANKGKVSNTLSEEDGVQYKEMGSVVKPRPHLKGWLLLSPVAGHEY